MVEECAVLHLKLCKLVNYPVQRNNIQLVEGGFQAFFLIPTTEAVHKIKVKKN